MHLSTCLLLVASVYLKWVYASFLFRATLGVIMFVTTLGEVPTK